MQLVGFVSIRVWLHHATRTSMISQEAMPIVLLNHHLSWGWWWFVSKVLFFTTLKTTLNALNGEVVFILLIAREAMISLG
jgi:hypothetical protein